MARVLAKGNSAECLVDPRQVLAYTEVPFTKFVFLGGLPGSGTTVTQHVLQSCGFAGGWFGEGQMHEKCPGPLRYPGQGKETDWYLRERLSVELKEKFREFLDTFRNGKPVYLDKTPRFTCFFPAFQEMFGDAAHFVVILRNPQDAVMSLWRRFKRTEAECQAYIEFMFKFVGGYQDRLGNLQYLRYEDFCRHPVESLYPLVEKLDVGVSREDVRNACEYHNVAPVVREPLPWPYSDNLMTKCKELGRMWGYHSRR